MERNLDLIRRLLFTLEESLKENTDVWVPRQLIIEPYTAEQVGYHAKLLLQAGYIEARDITPDGSPTTWLRVSSISWAGHQFLDAARDESTWTKAKDAIRRIGGVSLPVLANLLTELGKKSLGF